MRYVLFLSLITAVMNTNAQPIVILRDLDANTVSDRLVQYVSNIRASGDTAYYAEADNNTIVFNVRDYDKRNKQCEYLQFILMVTIDTISDCKSNSLVFIETECGENEIPRRTKETWFKTIISRGLNCGTFPLIMAGESYLATQKKGDTSRGGEKSLATKDSDEIYLQSRLEYCLSLLEKISRM